MGFTTWEGGPERADSRFYAYAGGRLKSRTSRTPPVPTSLEVDELDASRAVAIDQPGEDDSGLGAIDVVGLLPDPLEGTLEIAHVALPYARSIAACFDPYRQQSARRFSSAV